jgi:hypothetical protein
MAPELPETLLEFIHASVPTFQAAEALLFFAQNRDRDFTAEEVVVGMRPRVITLADVKESAALFTERRLVTETNGRFRFHPASWELECRVGELSHAYNERPVTLIIAIHHAADGHIDSFADSMKFRAGRM